MFDVRSAIIGRIFLVLGLVLLFPVAIALQIVRIQWFEGNNLKALWNAQTLDYIAVQAQRGNILDSEGRVLATNSITYTAAIDPLVPGITREQIDLVCNTLARHTGQSATHYQRLIHNAPRGSRYIVLGRNLSGDAHEALRVLSVRGLILEEQYRRRYNFESLASHVVGHVNHEFTGVMGLESYYNRVLSGKDGQQQVRKDRNNRIYAYVGAPRKRPEQGHTLQTTINAQIQAIVEEELRSGVERSRAGQGTAIVINPKTGAIVAMANYPDFNPNNPGRSDDENRRNFAVSDMIEPGSTFKLVTAVAAIEQKVVHLDEIFETPENGRRLIHGQWMRDHDPLGTLNFRQVIEKSSNIATAEVAMRLKPDTFYQYARNLGFGTATSIDLPNEENGRLRKPFEWSLVTLPWMSVGYEVQVTPLQMAMAYAALANGGNLMRPYVVEKIIDENGRTVRETRPHILRQAIHPKTIETLMPVFEGVISDSGTAQYASIAGIPIAGKTGTAQKYIDGRYRTRYRASFVGFYPTDDPRYVCLILLDEPKTSIYGGYVAGPVFRNISRRIIGLDNELHRSVNRDQDPVYWTEVPSVKGLTLAEAAILLKNRNIPFTTDGRGARVTGQEPAPGTRIENGDKVVVALEISEPGESVNKETHSLIPDVRGMAMRQAVQLLHENGYQVQRTGSGTVYAQFPEAGAVMQKGRPVTIRGRARPMETLSSAGR
ncbi:MAG: penicillin-binding transpeptidase domain-containing protein [Cyclonatronaceae bacterium]